MATTDTVVYPETDGKPMGETELHRNWMIRLHDIFKFRYRDQQVYIGCDLLLYYEEGNPKRSVVPDVFVVQDCDPGLRRIYKRWEEDGVPSLVVEVTSKSTRRTDEGVKPGIYQRLGIEEYVLYDPTAEYLDPPLQGYRLDKGGYCRIAGGAGGEIACQTLGITFELNGRDLLVRDSQTGVVLPTGYEALETKYKELEADYEAERAARRALEAEIEGLRQRGDDK